MTVLNRLKCLNSLHLKLLAMALMLCDHMWATVIPGAAWMTSIGRLAFPIFAFFVAEGCRKTRDYAAYLRRLFCFAARPTGGCFYYVPLPRVLQSSSAVFSLTNVTEYDTVKSTTIVNEKGGAGQCRKNRLKNCRRLSWT